MPNVGPLEIAVVLIIVLIIFGPKRLPELGRSMGKGIREFRGSIGGAHDDDDDNVEKKRRELEAAEAKQAAKAEQAAAEPVEGEVVTDNKA